MAAVGAWPVPYALYVRCGGVANLLGTVWPPWGVAGPLGLVWHGGGMAIPLGSVWLPWGVADQLGFVWLPWWRGWSPGIRMAAVEAWQLSWASYGSCGGVANPLDPYCRRGGVAGLLSSVRWPWGRGWSSGPCMAAWGRDHSNTFRMAAVGAWPLPWAPIIYKGGVIVPLGPVGPPWECGRSPGSRMAAVGTWPVPWAPYGRRGSVAGPLGPVRPPWGCGWSPWLLWPLWERGQSLGPRIAAVGAWLVYWVPYGCRGGMAGPLGLVWPPWGVTNPMGTCGRRVGVVGCLGPVWLPKGVIGLLGPVRSPRKCGRSPGPRMGAFGTWPVTWGRMGT